MTTKLRFYAVFKHIFLVLFLSLSLISQAAYLKDVPTTLTQPNGEKLNCLATGDEFYHYLHDADGYTIVKNPQTGWFVYATLENDRLVATDFVPNHVNPQSVGLTPRMNITAKQWIAKREAIEQATPKREIKYNRELNHGDYNNLVICIRFRDDAELGTTVSELDSMFNANNQGSISLYNYFKQASYNQLSIHAYPFPQPESETLISYEDIHPREYYQPYNEQTNPIGYQEWERNEREFSLLERACEFVADAVPDTLNFDYNDDGCIDNVIFVVKGDVGDWGDLLWPHRWSLFDRTVYINGKQVWDFNFQLETSSYFSVSTLCHEMFHSLGAPDLYHYNYDLSPVGGWDLMCNNSQPPQHSGAYMKHKYGNWIDEIPEITEYGTYTLDAIGWEGNRHHCYKIATSDPNQFYVVEFRNKDNAFETGLPASGLLIYRIDTRYNGCASYNGYDQYDEVYIFRPGGGQTTDGVINSANFAADYNRTCFNKNTDPKPFLTGGTADESFNICNITEIGNTIQFTYCPINYEIIPVNLMVNVVGAHDVNLTWNAVTSATVYKLYRDGQLVGDNITSTNYTDQNIPDGYHKYYVASVVDGQESFHSEMKSVIIGDYCNLIFI
jgi:M6 family metalloprotease domain